MVRTTEKVSSKRSVIKVIMGCLLLALGVAVLLYPIVGDTIAQWHREQSAQDHLTHMLHLDEDRRQHYLDLAREYNDFMFNWQQGGQPKEGVSYEEIGIQMGRTFGTLDIPALNIQSMPFYHGTSYQTLMRGLGHLEQSSIPIGGENTRGVITGHSGVHNQLLFTEIKRLREGDIFFVNILGERLAYEIESFDTVLPEDVDSVRIRPGHDMVTLLTCTPPGINTFRLLVNGFRIPYEEAIQREVIVRNWWNYKVIVLGSLAFGVIFLTVSLLRYKYLKRMMLRDELIKVERGTKKLKNFLRGVKVLFSLFLLISILVLAFATFGFFRMQGVVPLGSMNIGSAQISEEMNERNRMRIITANYDEGQIASVTSTVYAQAMSMTWDTVNDWGIGRLLIPELEMDLPILAGICNTNLVTGGSTYRMDQRLGSGNYVLLAHSVYGNGTVLFQPLENAQIGQRIYATDFLNIYTYEVTFNEVIVDTQVEFLEELEDEDETPIITLMRCEGGIGTIHRRLVQGQLVSVEPLNPQAMEMFDLIHGEDREGQGVVETTDTLPLLIAKNPVSDFHQFGVAFAARIISDPVQVALPLFMLLLFPILFLSLLPSRPKVKKDESYKKIVFDE